MLSPAQCSLTVQHCGLKHHSVHFSLCSGHAQTAADPGYCDRIGEERGPCGEVLVSLHTGGRGLARGCASYSMYVYRAVISSVDIVKPSHYTAVRKREISNVS